MIEISLRIDPTRIAGHGEAVTSSTAPSAAPSAATLPEPMTVLLSAGDPGAMVAALVAKSAQGQRAVRDQVRRSEEASQNSAEKSHVLRLRAAASSTRSAAIVSGLATAASGACSVAAAPNASAGDRRWAAGSEMASGFGKAGAGLYEAEAADARAAAAEAEHQAGRAGRNAKSAADGIDDLNRLVDKALAFYKEYTAAKNQTLQAATHRA